MAGSGGDFESAGADEGDLHIIHFGFVAKAELCWIVSLLSPRAYFFFFTVVFAPPAAALSFYVVLFEVRAALTGGSTLSIFLCLMGSHLS